MVSQVGFVPRAVVWRTLIKTMKRCGDSTHRAVTKGGKRGTTPQTPNHGRSCRITAQAAEKSQQCHKYLLQYSALASDRPQVRTWGRQACFLPRAPSKLVTPMSTHHCPTPTQNDCDLTPSTGTQSSQQEHSYLTASKRHPSTSYSHNNPQSFSRGTRRIFFRHRQNMCIHVLGMLPGYLKN